MPGPAPFLAPHSPIRPPMLPVTNMRPERRRFMSGRKAWSICTVPTKFTSSTEPTASAECTSMGPCRPRPALHTVGRGLTPVPPAPPSVRAGSVFPEPQDTWFGHRTGKAPVCFGEAHPARPRGLRSHVPWQQPRNLRPARPAAASSGSRAGTLGTRQPPTVGPACSGPVKWHTLEVGDKTRT